MKITGSDVILKYGGVKLISWVFITVLLTLGDPDLLDQLIKLVSHIADSIVSLTTHPKP